MVSANGTTVVSLEGLLILALNNVYEKVKIFGIIESTKPRGNADDPLDLKRFFFCINILDKFLTLTNSEQIYISLAKYLKTHR